MPELRSGSPGESKFHHPVYKMGTGTALDRGSMFVNVCPLLINKKGCSSLFRLPHAGYGLNSAVRSGYFISIYLTPIQTSSQVKKLLLFVGYIVRC
jgi:hypothetical protein